MRRFIITTTAALIAGAGVSLSHAGDVSFGVAITGEIVPGVYGHVVLGNRPPPPVVYTKPMVIAPPPRGVAVAPIYLNVPPDYARHWKLHCREYHACNRPVYFVRTAEYEPGFNMARWRREHPHHGQGHPQHERRSDHDQGHHYGHDRDHDDHRDH